MFLVENKCIAGVPCLHVAPKDYFYDQLPLVIFVHGFTSAKEHNLHYAYELAKEGFRVVLPEAYEHGERQTVQNNKQLEAKFWHIVLQTIEEINGIKEELVNNQLVDQNRIGLAGTSMGGFITLGSLTQYKWIRTAVSLMGMPYFEKFALWQLEQLHKQGVTLPISDQEVEELLTRLREVDLSLQPEQLEQRPLLFWHGEKDPVVPYSYTHSFYQEVLRPQYRKSPMLLDFISDPKAEHKVSREGMFRMVDWFKTHLLEEDKVMQITSQAAMRG